MDWNAWHDRYDAADSWMARRLRTVQGQIRIALDHAPAGPLKVVSLCAGDGRDLLHVLRDHPRRRDVRARLVEWDPADLVLICGVFGNITDSDIEHTVSACDQGTPEPLHTGTRLFEFVGYGVLRRRGTPSSGDR